MDAIQFDEPEYARPLAEPRRSWLTGLVIRTGLARDEQSAGYVLLGVALLAFAVSAYLLFSGGGAVTHPKGLPPPPAGGWQPSQPAPTVQ